MSFKFEKLKVWEKSIELVNEVYQMTKEWSKEEIYILTSQIKRTTDSVSLNLTEGRVPDYSIRSGLEVMNCLYLGKGRNLIYQDEFNLFYEKLTEIIKIITMGYKP